MGGITLPSFLCFYHQKVEPIYVHLHTVYLYTFIYLLSDIFSIQLYSYIL